MSHERRWNPRHLKSGVAASAATEFEQVVVLKGDRTVVTDGTRLYINDTGNSALSKAGSGDVLTGIIAGLVANGASPFDAAATGAFVHGCAATTAGTGDELVAPDLVDALHATFEVLRSP